MKRLVAIIAGITAVALLLPHGAQAATTTRVPYQAVAGIGVPHELLQGEYPVTVVNGRFTVDVFDAAVPPGGSVWLSVWTGPGYWEGSNQPRRSVFNGCVKVQTPREFRVNATKAWVSVISTSVPVSLNPVGLSCYGSAWAGVLTITH